MQKFLVECVCTAVTVKHEELPERDITAHFTIINNKLLK
jgi:hypothetical protein